MSEKEAIKEMNQFIENNDLGTPLKYKINLIKYLYVCFRDGWKSILLLIALFILIGVGYYTKRSLDNIQYKLAIEQYELILKQQEINKPQKTEITLTTPTIKGEISNYYIDIGRCEKIRHSENYECSMIFKGISFKAAQQLEKMFHYKLIKD